MIIGGRSRKVAILAAVRLQLEIGSQYRRVGEIVIPIQGEEGCKKEMIDYLSTGKIKLQGSDKHRLEKKAVNFIIF